MKANFIAFFLIFLMRWIPINSHRYQDINENVDPPTDEERDFFRLLLLSRYGPGAPDYATLEDEKPIVNPYFYPKDAKIMIPFRQAVENYVDWKKENQPYSQDLLNEEDQFIPENEHLYGNQRGNLDGPNTRFVPTEDTSTTSASSTTPEPDLLASMPPVTPNKGQKEFVMLRPPVDNHRKIEHWMQSMANGVFGLDNHIIRKKSSVAGGKSLN